MTKFLIPHTILPHSVDVMWQQGNEGVAQVALFVGDQEVYYVLVPRELLQKLGHDIALLLREEPARSADR